MIRARIVPDLLDKIEDFFRRNDFYEIGGARHRHDPKFRALCDRIAGKEVDLIFIGDDAFEAIDNNYWLPNCCWENVESAHATMQISPSKE